MENYLIAEPIKIAIYDPVTTRVLRTIVCLGNVPRAIAIAANNQGEAKNRKILQEFYGRGWKDKLGAVVDDVTGGNQADGLFDARDELGDWEEQGISDQRDELGDWEEQGISDQRDELGDWEEQGISDQRDELGGYGGEETTGGYSYDDDILELDESMLEELSQKIDMGVSAEDANLYFEEDSAITKWDGGVYYDTTTNFYPCDKIMDAREKIYLATGIPFYRQHVFYKIKQIAVIAYEFYINDNSYTVDIQNLMKYRHNVNGIPIDYQIYLNREGGYKITALDEFRTIDNFLVGSTFYVADLGGILAPIRAQFDDIAQDLFKFEQLYYGFIIKYFPHFSINAFQRYLTNEKAMREEYPLLSRSKKMLMSKYDKEAKMLNSLYNHIHENKYQTLRKSIDVNITYIQLLSSIGTIKQNVMNIRNIFDKMHTSEQLPFIVAYTGYNNREYILTKENAVLKSNANLKAIKVPQWLNNGVVFAIKHKQINKYIFLNIREDGHVTSETNWEEEDAMTLARAIDFIAKRSNPVIEQINQLDKFAFTDPSFQSLTPISADKYKVKSIDIIAFWEKITSTEDFRIIRDIMYEYEQANIVAPKALQKPGIYDYKSVKGISYFDSQFNYRKNVEIANSYIYLTDATMLNRWKQLYTGKKVKIIQQISKLKFAFSDIDSNEFEITLALVVNAIYMFLRRERGVDKSDKKKKNINKLEEQDPDLYDLKKYGIDKLYSVLCQRPFQPTIYTDEELRSLPKNKLNRLVKYWNFTRDKPAYYECPNSRYPQLGFIVGKHPKNYCLPCCRKVLGTEQSGKKKTINEICSVEHIFTEDDYEFLQGDSSIYIINYNPNKMIDIDRICKLPPILTQIFTTDKDDYGFYALYGVSQYNYSGLLFCMAAIVGNTPAEFIKNLLKRIRNSDVDMFYNLLSGSLDMFFNDMKDLCNSIENIFINKTLATTSFTKWNDLFEELLMYYYGHYFVIFNDETFDQKNVRDYILTLDSHLKTINYLISTGSDETPNISALVRQGDYYYPIFYISIGKNSKLQLEHRSFAKKDTIAQNIRSLIVQEYRGEGDDPHSLQGIIASEAKEYKLRRLFVNNQDFCYAVLLERKDGKFAYFPTKFSFYNIVELSANIKVDHKPFRASDYDLPFDTLMDFYKNHVKMDNPKEAIDYNLVRIDGESLLYIGFIYREYRFYYTAQKASPNPAVGNIYIKYDYYDVNMAIYNKEPPSIDYSVSIDKALYENYIYKLFVIEFINYINQSKDTKIHNAIIKIVEKYPSKSQFKDLKIELHTLLGEEYQNDAKAIISHIINYYYGLVSLHEVIETLNNTLYEFDRSILGKFASMSEAELAATVQSITEKIVAKKQIADINSFPNILIPCAIESSDYCDRGKLIVDAKYIKDLTSVFIYDLQNKFKLKNLYSNIYINNSLNFFGFTANRNELISVNYKDESEYIQ